MGALDTGPVCPYGKDGIGEVSIYFNDVDGKWSIGTDNNQKKQLQTTSFYIELNDDDVEGTRTESRYIHQQTRGAKEGPVEGTGITAGQVTMTGLWLTSRRTPLFRRHSYPSTRIQQSTKVGWVIVTVSGCNEEPLLHCQKQTLQMEQWGS
ncbi:hypothetical protein ACJJTC_010980 [Scirpophaga incertulas]